MRLSGMMQVLALGLLGVFAVSAPADAQATDATGAAPPGPAANDTGAPDWARRIRASQTVRDAGMAAASAVRDGDRPGGGESPRLKDEE